MANLKNFAKSLTTILPFMDNKTKGSFDELLGQVVTITDFGFLKDGNNEYAVFTVKEHSEKFYFGGMVLSENLREIEAEGLLPEVQKEGLPVLFDEKMSKNKRSYTTVKFYPEG